MILSILLLVVIIAAMAALVAVFVSAQRARRSAAPFFPTSTSAIRAALKAANLAPDETFYDLGAGTGAALLIAERDFGARTTGFEISILPYWIAKMNLWACRSKSNIVFKNFFDEDLRNADVIFCFLAVRTMQKMEDKIKAGLKPGARVIVHAFPLPTMVPTRTIDLGGQWKMYLYEVR